MNALMNIFRICLALAAALLCVASVAAQAKTLSIGIDLSGSNPLLTHQNFADAAARHAMQAIEALKEGDVVHVRTFGSRDEARNLLNHSATIGRRMRAQKVAQAVGDLLRSLPRQSHSAQASTNLLAWLEFGSGFGCADQGEILVITDGIESSSLVSAQALLDGKAKLPKPGVDLKGCTLTFYGLGAGLPAQYVKRLRSEWQRWAEKSGARFTAVIP